MSAFPWRPRPVLLFLPLAVSFAPWVLTATLFAQSENLEGAMLGTALIGAVSFLLTGPLAGIVLASFARRNPIVFWKFAGLFFLLSAPALGFQIINFSMSIMPAVLHVGTSPETGSAQFEFVATAVGVVWYSAFLALFYRASKGNARQTFVAASLLVALSFVFLASRLVR